MNCRDVILDPADSEGMKELYKRKKKRPLTISIFGLIAGILAGISALFPPHSASYLSKLVIQSLALFISFNLILFSTLNLKAIKRPFDIVLCKDGLKTPRKFIAFKDVSYIKIIKNNNTTNIIFYPKERTSLINSSLYEIGLDWYYHPDYIRALKETGVPIRFEDRSTRVRPEQWEIEELWPYKTDKREWANSWRPPGDK